MTVKPFAELTVDEFVQLPAPHLPEYPYSVEVGQIEYLGRYFDNEHQLAVAGHRYSFRVDITKYSFFDFRDMDSDVENNKQIARTLKGFRNKLKIASGSREAGRLIAELRRSFYFHRLG